MTTESDAAVRPAAVVRPAATIMVVRDAPPGSVSTSFTGPSQLEVLMLRRNVRSEFAGGVYVFPGGAVDPSDGGDLAEGLCYGRTDKGASALLGVDAGGLTFWVAALRECFEEAGVLLAYRPRSGPKGFVASNDQMLSFLRDEDEQRFANHRRDINAKYRHFVDVCTQEGVFLATDRVHYFAHWITPRGAPRRYDTRFFVAAAPPDQTALHDAGETDDLIWTAPAEALRRHREGQIELVFPTIRNLQAISRFSTGAELLDAAAAAADRVPTVEPRVVVEGNGVRILLPGDPGYDEVAPPPAPLGRDVADMNAAMQAISRAANRDRGDEEPPFR